MGIPPEYFVTPGFELDPFSFSLSEIIDEIDIPPIAINETIEFEIPGGTPNGICLDVIDFHENIIDNLSFPVPTEALQILFSDYDYMTVNEGSIVLTLNDANFLYPVKITYAITSEVDGLNNEIFTDQNTSINSLENIAEEVVFYYNISPDYEGDFSCDLCIDPNTLLEYACNGFQVDSESNYSISIDGAVNIDNIYSITGTTNPFTQNVEESFPLVNNVFDILSGEISSTIENNLGEPLNQLEFEVTNNSQIPLTISFTLLNFKDDQDEILQLAEFTVDGNGATQERIKPFNNSSIEHYPYIDPNDPQEVIDEIYMELNIDYPLQEGTFVMDNLYNFDVNGVNIRSIEFDKITTVVHDFIVDVPSLSLSSVPSGIEGIEFVNPILTINLDNMIEINNTLTFNLEALFEGEIVSTINIEVDVNVPIPNNGDESVVTKIELEGTEYTVFHGDTEIGSYPLENSLIQFLQVQSDELRVSGQASLNGTGNLEPGDETYGKTISGDFELYVPFKMILGEEINGEYTNINIIPAQETYLSPIDQSTKESIDNSFIQANLVSSITNHSPFVGVVSILVSTDENFFPLNIDKLINDEEFILCNPYCTYSDENESIFLAIKDSLSAFELNIGDADDIDSIQYTPLSDIDSRIKHLKLFSEMILYLYHGLAMLELPHPFIDESGNVEEAGQDNYVSLIDKSQISLINYTDLDKPRYMNTLITLVNSPFYSNSDDPENSGIINITINDYITISSYSSFLINVGDY